MPHYSNYGGTYLSAQSFDELTGAFSALSETTNFRPNQGEEIGVIHPSYKPDPRGYEPGPVGSLSETFGDGDPRILGPISGEGVFKPQDIDAKGSVILGDNHFMPDRDGDSLSGAGRPTKIWTNGGASTFEDRHVGDYDANDAVFGVKENIDWTAANGGPGSSYMTAKLGTTAGPGGSTYMTGSIGCQTMPPCSLGGSAGPGGDDI